MASLAIPAVLSAGSMLFGFLNKKHDEKKQYEQQRLAAEQDWKQRMAAYESAMQQFELRQAMLRKYIDSNDQLKSLAPKEYMDALNKSYRPATAPVFQYPKFGSSSTAMNTFLQTGLGTAANLWPKTPAAPYANPTSVGMNGGSSIFKPTDLMGGYTPSR
jgi:hypothetical protein